ncbi:acyltransferase family protein [Pseudomonas nitroreducens]|uniref:acyltransferase family protein n=1 Tax=Pseudomonas nitroreducens TaxID=46680 RepID=UPI00351D6415
MLLSNVLRKENNNLDIFRVVAAVMVIYGHAYALLPVEGQRDIVGKLLVFDYSGSLAVKIFFFLSGLVVTNSLIEKKGCSSVSGVKILSDMACFGGGAGSMGLHSWSAII